MRAHRTQHVLGSVTGFLIILIFIFFFLSHRFTVSPRRRAVDYVFTLSDGTIGVRRSRARVQRAPDKRVDRHVEKRVPTRVR
jgi:hypothetical protein